MTLKKEGKDFLPRHLVCYSMWRISLIIITSTSFAFTAGFFTRTFITNFIPSIVHNFSFSAQKHNKRRDSLLTPDCTECSIDAIKNIENVNNIDLNINVDNNGRYILYGNSPEMQHLSVDIKNVNKNFLKSEERLQQAMLDVLSNFHMDILSYNCHENTTSSHRSICTSVLVGAHMILYVWPEAGIITIDMMVRGNEDIDYIMAKIETHFAIPKTPQVKGKNILEDPFIAFSYRNRGLQPEHTHIPNDVNRDVTLIDVDLKKKIIDISTDFQRIQLFDLLDDDRLSFESYVKSHSDDNSYEATNPHLFRLDRNLFLDGVMQSTFYGNEAYHEALVQPVMFAHSNPKRVAIIGGGECATLREVLKHKSLEKVTMVEIDEEIVDVAKEHLREWSNCEDLEGSKEWCGDDEKVEFIFKDALAWFKDHYLHNFNERDNEHFDVVIMDVLDPQQDDDIAQMLYNDITFFDALYKSLSEDGILVIQVGAAPDERAPSEHLSKHRKRAYLMELLDEVGFQSLHAYEEQNCGFGEPWSFIIAMKEYSNRALWYRAKHEIDLAIRERITKTVSGSPALKYFDGATMHRYQIPHKSFEHVYCRNTPQPDSCKIWNHINSNINVRKSDIEVRRSGYGEQSGRGIFTKVDILEGSSILKEDFSSSLYFRASTTAILNKIVESEKHQLNLIKNIMTYMVGYGWQSYLKGEEEFWVDSGILTFCNHGCNNTHNIGDHLIMQNRTERVYDPHRDRHLHQSENSAEYALKNIAAGQELLCDYLGYSDDDDDERQDTVDELTSMCAGYTLGEISRVEYSEKNEVTKNTTCPLQ